ncbi:MAG: PAS domain-containing protein [Proteobacteria bacterium]|nr:PAS domain-containing protein [Pseudomonadota bacterium]
MRGGTHPERRSADRRRAPRDESWFGTLGEHRSAEPEPSADARQSLQSGFERIHRAFLTARAALGLALVVALVVTGLFGLRPNEPVMVVTIVYAVLSIGLWLLPKRLSSAAPQALSRPSSGPWLATIGVDVVCFTALHLLAASSSLNYVALLVLPVLMGGVLTPPLLARATAAAVTLALLGNAWRVVAAGGDATGVMTQAALTGIGLFAITIVAGELAARLAREESSARGSAQRALQQEQLNRLVIEEMQDGVLVVDRQGMVRAANPAALRLLVQGGMGEPAPFQLRGVPAWQALVGLVEQAFVDAAWPEAGRDVALRFAGGGRRALRARIRFTRQLEASEELCVLFLEDVRNMQARSRQEKLAAMGRVSAGIAHEIRNPLAAIAQANALLAEDATDAPQRRLTQMVTENVGRLKRIVDDVMEIAPGVAVEATVIDATAQVETICQEWLRGLGPMQVGDGMLRMDLPTEPLGVVFDAEHLRRVVVNLLDNAHRHASRQPGAIHVRLDSRHEAQAFLSIASDGPPIPPDVEPYLFEPFFSTRSRGTGLGLYICRELCERYGATIDYRLRGDGNAKRNEFYVDMRRRPFHGSEVRSQATVP